MTVQHINRDETGKVLSHTFIRTPYRTRDNTKARSARSLADGLLKKPLKGLERFSLSFLKC